MNAVEGQFARSHKRTAKIWLMVLGLCSSLLILYLLAAWLTGIFPTSATLGNTGSTSNNLPDLLLVIFLLGPTLPLMAAATAYWSQMFRISSLISISSLILISIEVFLANLY